MSDLETAVEDAKNAYLQACPADLMTQRSGLFSEYRDWVNNYNSYEETTKKELERMSFTAPRNPS